MDFGYCHKFQVTNAVSVCDRETLNAAPVLSVCLVAVGRGFRIFKRERRKTEGRPVRVVLNTSTTDPTLLTTPVMYDSALFLLPLHYQLMRGVCVDGACLVERGGAFLIYRIVKDWRARFFCLRNGCVSLFLWLLWPGVGRGEGQGGGELSAFLAKY